MRFDQTTLDGLRRVAMGVAICLSVASGGLVLPDQALAQTAVTDKVGLLSGLAKMESDLQLGMLFLQDGLTNPEGSHFTHPRKETFPYIKDALAAAGVADLEPLLQKLEAGGEKDAVMAAYVEVVAAVIQARETLKPESTDLVQSIVGQARDVVAEINAAGPTEVNNFQDAWAMLMVARSQVDLLLRDENPAIAKAASEMALVLDDVILSMPDPNQSAPITVDPAPYQAALAKLEALAGSV